MKIIVDEGGKSSYLEATAPLAGVTSVCNHTASDLKDFISHLKKNIDFKMQRSSLRRCTHVWCLQIQIEKLETKAEHNLNLVLNGGVKGVI